MAIRSAAQNPPSTGRLTAKVIFIALGFTFLSVTAYLAAMTAVRPEDTRAARLSIEDLGKLSPGELAAAQDATQAAFANDPLDAGSLSQLSRIAEVLGDQEASDRLKLIAGDMQPRALGIQAEALEVLLQRGDFAAAMTTLDGLIRARPNQSPQFFAVAAEIAAASDGRVAVAASIARRPPWRKQFIASTISAGKPRVIEQIFSELRTMGMPADAPELALLIGHYLENGEINAAYVTWLASLDAEELKRVKLVYDGGFDQKVRNLRFDWTVEPAKGFTYRLFPRNTASMDATLQIDFKSFQGSFANLSQILRLRPGRYRLSGEVRFDGFESPSGIAFRLHCLNNGKLNLLDETGRLPQSRQWISFEKTLVVPAADCPVQLLRLESPGDAGATGLIGQVALDNITVDTLPPFSTNSN